MGRNRRVIQALVIAAIALAPALAGCGDPDDGSDSRSDSTTTTQQSGGGY